MNQETKFETLLIAGFVLDNIRQNIIQTWIEELRIPLVKPVTKLSAARSALVYAYDHYTMEKNRIGS